MYRLILNDVQEVYALSSMMSAMWRKLSQALRHTSRTLRAALTRVAALPPLRDMQRA